MKKYRLLKDLSTWKAGEEFYLKEDRSLYGKDGEKEIMVYHSKTIERFDILDNKEWFEEIKKEKSIFDLEILDIYYYIEDDIINSTPYDGLLFEDKKIISGNAFASEQEAEQELKKRQAIQRIKKYCWENDIKTSRKIDYDLEGTEDKEYYQRIYFHHLKNRFVCGDARFDCAETLEFFKSTNDALQVIKNCEDDLKIIFNM